MLLVLIFVIPGWLVHDYQILQTPLALKDGVCHGFSQDDGKTCSELNPWFASEVY